MKREELKFEYISQISGLVITSINLINISSFIKNKENQIMIKRSLNFLEVI